MTRLWMAYPQTVAFVVLVAGTALVVYLLECFRG